MHIGIRIGGALVVGIAIILGAFYLRAQTNNEAQGGIAAVSGAFEGRDYIGDEDRDGNGVSDWEDELRSMALRDAKDAPVYTEPKEGAENPTDTLTGTFARSFFEMYVRNDAAGTMNEARVEKFLDASISSLESDTRDMLYTKKDIVLGDGSVITLRDYGNSVSEILARHSFKTESEIVIFERAIQNDSEEELKKLTNIADAYDAILTDTLMLTAPEDLVTAHIALVNAYLAIRNDIRAMEQSFSDPLYALIRVKRYQDDVIALQESLKRIYTHIEDTGIVYEEGEPGADGSWYLTH